MSSSLVNGVVVVVVVVVFEVLGPPLPSRSRWKYIVYFIDYNYITVVIIVSL